MELTQGLSTIFAPHRRAILLDVVVFAANLVLMLALTHLLSGLAAQARTDFAPAQIAMSIFCLALAFLQPLGTLLKRWGAHQRNAALTTDIFSTVWGHIFLPVNFITQVMFLIFASTLLVEAAGADYQLPTGLFAALFLGIPALAAGNTFLAWFYFKPSTVEPRLKLLASPYVETLGDACIFLGVLCYQAFLWYLLDDPYFSTRPASLGDLVGKIVSFAFLALFFYFPPRIFYLAEDPDRRLAWLRMLLANAPIILRILLGSVI